MFPLVASHAVVEQSPAHTQTGTVYGEQSVKAYAKRHAPDLSRFLDPYLLADIQGLYKSGASLLDVGCGAAPHSIFAGHQGFAVRAIDIQPSMIEAAKAAIQTSGLADRVIAEVGNGAELTFADKTFDVILSVNVGCNLSKDLFSDHFEELARALKIGGSAIVASPNSLPTVFTDGSIPKETTFERISKTLESLPDDPGNVIIRDALMQLTEVTSATFFMKDHRLTLLQQEDEIAPGTPIWRKISMCAIPNFYYPQSYYLSTFEENGFDVSKFDNATLSADELIDGLGPEYHTHSPFAIYQLKKRDVSSSTEVSAAEDSE